MDPSPTTNDSNKGTRSCDYVFVRGEKRGMTCGRPSADGGERFCNVHMELERLRAQKS